MGGGCDEKTSDCDDSVCSGDSSNFLPWYIHFCVPGDRPDETIHNCSGHRGDIHRGGCGAVA